MNASFLNIHDMVLIVTLVECVFMATLLNVIPAKRVQPRRIFSAFFILIAIWIVATLFVWNEALQSTPINQTITTSLVLVTCLLLQGPTLYFYLCSLREDVNWLNWRTFIHGVPAVICALLIIGFNITGAEWPWRALMQLPVEKKTFVKLVWNIVRYSPVIYMFACFYAEYRLRQHRLDVFSNVSSLELIFANVVFGGFLFYWLWSMISYSLGGFLPADINALLGMLNDLIIVLLINGLFILGFFNTHKVLQFTEADTTKPAGFSIDPDKIKLIETIIAEQKPYLESNINLERFAALAGLKPRDFSTHVNTHYGLNFFDFINALRLDEAKRLMAMPENASTSILDIMFRAGFNSQSTFQRFFKKKEGITPSEYRRLAQKKDE